MKKENGSSYFLVAAFLMVAGFGVYKALRDEPNCPDEDTGVTFDYTIGLCQD